MEPVLPSDRRAFLQDLRTAKTGNTEAMVRVGEAYERGRGTWQDKALARCWYRRATKAYHGSNLHGIRWAERKPESPVVEQHDHEPDIRAILGQARTARSSVRRSLLYLHAARFGSREAAYKVGQAFLEGLDFDFDYGIGKWCFSQGCPRTGEVWLECAAEAGHVRAMFELALYNHQECQDDSECAESERWYTAAAEAGDQDAMFNLGQMFAEWQDGRKAVQWYRRAAEGGHVDAMRRLGVRLLKGGGTQRDPVEAYYWFRSASEKGDVRAMARLGLLYIRGTGVRRNHGEAFFWLRRAANLSPVVTGNDHVWYLLGRMWESGRGVRRNVAEALRCYANAPNHLKACQRHEAISRKGNDPQVD